MPEDSIYPPGFDASLDMNMIGPIPRPDGSLGGRKPQSHDEKHYTSLAMPSFTDTNLFNNHSSGVNQQAGGVGLDEDGFMFRPPLHSLSHNDDGSIQDTHTALEGLFSGSLSQQSPEQPTLNLSPARRSAGDNPAAEAEEEAVTGQKRRAGTSRVNMLARGAACEFCKRRKLKCSAEYPTCAACKKGGKTCVYSQKKVRSKVRQLEDRLAELEKKLDDPTTSHEITPTSTPFPNVTLDGDLGMGGVGDTNPPGLDFWERFAGAHGNTAETGFTFNAELADWGLDQSMETTLMTLADAAASDVVPPTKFGWETMDEVELASEIVKAVEGGKGVGEKIVGHLLQLYVNPQVSPFLHRAVNPTSFLARLLPTSPSPPHPALILALIPLLLPLSPSPSLSSPDRCKKILVRLETPARLHAQHALAVADSRLIDIVAANNIRSMACFENARLLEGWGGNASVSLAWAAGLAKLGGIGEQFVQGYEVEHGRLSKDKRLREARFRAVVVEPPKTAKELGQRIHLFWQVYLADKAPTVGWGFPSLINDEEITTPFPQDNYDTDAALLDNTTINDLFAGHANSGQTDTDYCAQLKSLCLLYRTTRLFDNSSSVSTSEKRAHLQTVTSSYMASLDPVEYGTLGAKVGPKAQAWQMLHLTMLLLHLKEDIDLPTGSEASAACIDAAVKSAESLTQAIEVLYITGDSELLGYDQLGVLTWGAGGRTIFRLAQRLEAQDPTDPRVTRLRNVGSRLIAACRVMGKRAPFAELMAQKLENNAAGADEWIGMWDRTDIMS